MQSTTAVSEYSPRSASPVTPIHELHLAPFQQDAPLVAPVARIEHIIEAWNSFTDLKLKLLTDADFVYVKGEHLAKKSVFRKLALAFGISVEITREDRIDFKDGTIAYLMTAKASSPNGRSMMACASCHSNEKKFSKASDARAVAQTRATNRCIADIVGYSAPSAEEVIGGGEVEVVAPPASAYVSRVPTRHAETAHVLASQPATTVSEGEKRSDLMTDKQRKLIVELLSQFLPDADEREEEVRHTEGFSKQDASDYISSLLRRERQVSA